MSKISTREEVLRKAAEHLNISPSKYKQAMERFDSMKAYLIDGDFKGATARPEVYLQGSFKLGTEIRPFKDSQDSDYDIDIVCLLGYEKEIVTPKMIKHQIGDHLKTNGTYSKMLDDEGKRCWTLNYAEQDGIGFHMDILPSVNENEISFKDLPMYPGAIAISNRAGNSGSYEWSTSNPRDFAKWFYGKNKIAFDKVKQQQKQILYEHFHQDGLFANQDAVPDIHVKTPLQQAIQLLKRHRDIRFSNKQNEKCKPISMVITVLAAQIYRNELSLYDTLANIISALSRHADQLQPTFRFNEAMAKTAYTQITRAVDGKWYIPNPTNYGENFADKWHEEEDGIPDARAQAFFQWVAWAKEDFINTADRLDEEYYIKSLVLNVNSNSEKAASRKQELLFDVPHRQKPESKWTVLIRPEIAVIVKASYNKNGWHLFSDGSSGFELNSGDSVEREKKICFKAQTNALKPFQVYWQVVNTGEEAADARCLRGDFYDSNGDTSFELGKKTRIEPTKYRGYHWIECFIVQNDVCVARSGEFVVRII